MGMALRGREFAHTVTKCIEILSADVTGSVSAREMGMDRPQSGISGSTGQPDFDALPCFRMGNQAAAAGFNRYRISPFHPFP